MPAETTLCFGYKVDTQSLIDAADEWHNVKKSLRFLGMVVHLINLSFSCSAAYPSSSLFSFPSYLQENRAFAGTLSFSKKKRASFADLPTELFDALRDAGRLFLPSSLAFP